MLLPKRKNKKYFYRALTFSTLLPLEKIINFVKTSGIEFDPKNPKTKIFYIVKLGLLDDFINKTTKNTNLNKNSQSSLLLPYSAVDRIVQIENLHSMGLSYRKIVKIYKKLKTSSLLITSKEGNSGISYNLSRKKPHQQISILPKHLIPTAEIIEMASKLNIDLGTSNPEERMRYLIKLGILPQTIKKMSQRYGKIVGHLPAPSVERLIYVSRLHLRGLSYPKIAEKIRRIEKRHNQSDANFQNNGFSLLEYQLNKKLHDHQKKIEKIVKDKLDQYLDGYKKQLLTILSQKTAHN
ncbi:hypothetical protein A3I53_01545 [Candidatus Curtissbacteria bacterium RIFCSPLOWO2_02_FULL_40_13b]|uniref:Uncharacterized protein n=2 Tax=Candidatus Curtissiibacteriota TaxID=1752717 RepID=A0A1F5HYG0_9BACT|nr:MAG: hypothetical protein A3F45_01310 [Candidatus Curtissbacteria bacterium RIFCSPHIGHO2_12_FULL_41_17]OGE09161.1 MAG: hypothetical protein A3I53_01545 [Candidatus Curtissbacteria bacterium RIFCSPLOWO2_02_FULL_40_13b]